MKIEELMFAAKVFEVAGRIAEGEQSSFARSIEHDKDTRDAQMKNWHAEHVTSSFVPKAYALLNNVALQITAIREAEAQANRS